MKIVSDHIIITIVTSIVQTGSESFCIWIEFLFAWKEKEKENKKLTQIVNREII